MSQAAPTKPSSLASAAVPTRPLAGCRRFAFELRGRAFVLAALLFSIGCSEDGSAGETGGTGGTAGGSSAKLADLGVEVPESVAAGCLGYAQLVCAAISRCAPANFGRAFLDQADCEREQQDDCRAYALPGVTIDASKLPSCFAGLAQVACEREATAVSVKEAEACAGLDAPGSLPDGAPCFIAAQCAGRACVKLKELANKIENSATEIDSLRVCGACASGNLTGGQGSPCGDPKLTEKACEDGLKCDGDGTCQPPKVVPIGGECGPGIDCDEQALCDYGVHKCVARRSEGEGCKDDYQCAEGLFCKAGACAKTLLDGESGCQESFHCGPNGIYGEEVRCVEGTCRRLSLLREGDACGSGAKGTCAAGLYCGNDKPFTCTREPSAGEPCRLCSDPLTAACCGPGLYCENKVCVANKAAACGG